MNKSLVEKKRKLKKGKLIRFIFCIISLIFFIFCVVFYGFRLIKYYKIYNPKSDTGEKIDLLSTHITKNASIVYEGDGLYRVNGIYMFKGMVENNYIYYSNMLWRIVRINADNSVEIVLDAPINNLKWNGTITEYKNADVHKYLNDVFLKTLNKDLLKKTSICTDIVVDLTKITCDTVYSDDYVKLLNITDYLNSKVKKTFINSEGYSLWLSDRNKTKAWYASANTILPYDTSESYLVKPSVTLKMEATAISGTGTKSDPYQVEKSVKNLNPGSYVMLGDDTWIVYENGKETSKLVLNGLYNKGTVKYRFDKTSNIYNVTKVGSLGNYLNTIFYKSLSYQDLLVENNWYTGPYQTSYKDIYTKQVAAKVGLNNIADMKFNLQEEESYLLTPATVGSIYAFGKHLTPSKVSMTKPIRPAIMIQNKKIKSGDGTEASPYILEV